MLKKINKLKRFEWRAAPRVAGPTSEQSTSDRKDRVALLVTGPNRDLISKRLQSEYDVIVPEAPELNAGSFDLAVVDIEGLRTWHDQLIGQKIREEPTFLPVVLVLSQRELQYRLKTFWDVVDELILAPVEPTEFLQRISLLMRTRRMALAQRDHLAYLVTHDRSTGLPNQSLLLERVGDGIRDASVLNQRLYVAVVQVPLTRVLQSFGHVGLEHATMQISSRLKTVLGKDAYIAKLTTDQWGLAFRAGEPMEKIVELVTRVQELADEPVDTGGEKVHLAPLIGVACYPEDAGESHQLLNCAAAALSGAKGSTPSFYSRQVQHEALRFVRIQTRLHQAFEQQQFELWYQPQVSLRTGTLVGVEALIRWRLPDGQLVPPGEFIPVAETTGQIAALDRWVIKAACAAMKRWKSLGIPVSRVAVNVTAADIEAPDFADMVISCLAENKLPASSLELELTETALLDTTPDNLQKLSRLRAHGLEIAIDDFGTGYSSLGYLHQLPISTLKVDKSFVDHVCRSSTDAAIVETIVWLARKFNLSTVAEGIESREQADFLAHLQVTTAQGYFYGRPMREDQLLEWVASRDSNCEGSRPTGDGLTPPTH